MGVVRNIAQAIASKLGLVVVGDIQGQAYRDNRLKGDSFSVEAEVSETLADLVCMFSTMPISGESERARWLDDISDKLFRVKLKPAVVAEFMTGDCLIVPSWNGRSIQNIIIDSDGFEVLGCVGDELTAIAYEVDSTTSNGTEYRLMQAIVLEEYESNSGETLKANHYRMYVARGDSGTIVPISQFEHWSSAFEEEWYIPNVDRLLVGRLKSHTVVPEDLNSVKGAPICYGASEPIQEIHYLLEQMHDEFGLSEKMIFADKRLFKKEFRGDDVVTRLPKGKERLFMQTGGNSGDPKIEEWSPDIRYQAYLDALDKQEKLVERAVGVSSGVISTPEDISYQNVDNVRKSQQKTMGFVSTARGTCEQCLLDLVYAWETIANYYGINPIGDYEVSFDWSNEFVETFADRQNAILAGIQVGAMDAVDYRMFVNDESPEAAQARVDEIKAQLDNEPIVIQEA